MTTPTVVTLHNGAVMPMIGFGCAGYVRSAALRDALGVGYKLFDTAQAHEWYLEEELGDAIAKEQANRSALWLTLGKRSVTSLQRAFLLLIRHHVAARWRSRSRARFAAALAAVMAFVWLGVCISDGFVS